MNPTKLKLSNPTDDELSAAVAEHVAGYKNVMCIMHPPCLVVDKPDAPGLRMRIPHYPTSADAVLPLLEMREWRSECVLTNGSPTGKNYYLEITGNIHGLYFRSGWCFSFPRAACIALLRANGIEVEQIAPAQK